MVFFENDILQSVVAALLCGLLAFINSPGLTVLSAITVALLILHFGMACGTKHKVFYQ